MQDHSANYVTAIRSHERPPYEVYGTITFTDSTTLAVNHTNLIQDSIGIERKCSESEDLEIGGVYSDKVELNIRDTTSSRYKFFNARISLNYKILVSTNTYETIHLGEFTITDADRENNTTISIVAYDDMRKLDKSLSSNALQGHPYDVLNYISLQTGYDLSFNEQYVLDNFINTDADLFIDVNSGIKTYRDAVKVVCQALGCCARDNRQGELELFKYSTTVVATLTTSHFYSVTVADFLCRYIGLSVTSQQGTFVSVSGQEDVGNVMKIPDAPAWDYGVESYLQTMTDRLFSYIKTIIYTPTEIDMPCDPTFDVGDRVKIVTDDGEEIETIITSYEWHISRMTLYSKGTNPYLEGVSTGDIASTRLLEKGTAENSFSYYTFTNTREITLTTTEQIIVDMTFGASQDTVINLWHEFKWDNVLADDTQKITLHYYYDGDLESYVPIQTYGEDGEHTFNTQYWLRDVSGNSAHNWRVGALLDSGSATIGVGDIHAMLSGQKLMAEAPWDHTIQLTVANNKDDKYVPLGRNKAFVSMLENVDLDAEQEIVPDTTVTETTGVLTRRRAFVGMADTIVHGSPQFSMVTFNLITEDGDNLITESDFNLITEGE